MVKFDVEGDVLLLFGGAGPMNVVDTGGMGWLDTARGGVSPFGLGKERPDVACLSIMLYPPSN